MISFEGGSSDFIRELPPVYKLRKLAPAFYERLYAGAKSEASWEAKTFTP